jgi:hypothetical protein
MLAPQQKDALAESRRMLSEQVADLFRNHIPLVPKKSNSIPNLKP